jgi:SMC interacting uncharacterized protein involved in chromosome segregation
MATVAERVSVLETQVVNIDEKIDDIKTDIKQVHDCLDRTGDELKAALKEMHESSSNQHDQLAAKISELEKFRMKGTYLVLGGLAVIGWVSGHIDTIVKILQ